LVAYLLPSMATAPAVTSETRKRQAEARNGLAEDVDEVIGDFIHRLNDVAEKHGWCVCFLMILF
jgi:hypothetical protein